MMKAKKNLKKKSKEERRDWSVNKKFHNFAMVSLCAMLAVSISVASRAFEDDSHTRVYAASETDSQAEDVSESLSVGIAGSVSGALSLNSEGTYVRRIGTSCEKVMVGQRVKRVQGQASKLSICESMESSVKLLDSTLTEKSKSAAMMSDTDYQTLMRIVEAEAGTEDIKGKILVANVILNRVENEAFPDTVTEVVWDQTNGVAQFSPTLDGRISEVTVTEETKEAVRQALEGVDYSNGALFFIERKAASKSNLEWFDSALKYLFKYGVHEFYTYPDSTLPENAESQETQQNQEAQQNQETQQSQETQQNQETQQSQETQQIQESQETSPEQTSAAEDGNIVQMVRNG